MNGVRGYRKHLLVPVVGALLLLAEMAPHLFGAEEVSARVADISGADYFPAVHREISEAKESIVVTMYSFMVFQSSSPTSAPIRLLQALVQAHSRGVKVSVILGMPFSYNKKRSGRVLDWRNEIAREMLTAGGVDVRYAGGGRTMHQKLIVIDGSTVICGSHNWSDPALGKNWEASVLVRSKQLAAQLLARIGKIKLKPADHTEELPEDTICVPKRFLTDRALAPAMYRVHEETGFDIFLLLWRQYVEKRSRTRSGMTVDLDILAGHLGKDNVDRSLYREEIKNTMRRLRDKYGLIECEFTHGGNATVRMTRDDLKRPRKGSGLPVPGGYWDYGWSRTLSLKSKVMFLICLAEEQSSPTRPWWTLSQAGIAKRYLNAKSIMPVNLGLRELERHDILQVTRHHPPKGKDFSRRRPNTYRLKRLLSQQQIMQEWKELGNAYGKERLAKARECAGMLDKPNSRETTLSFLRAIEQYGADATEKETRAVAKLPPDNAYRTVAYVVYLLKKKKE